jgi:CubicO group peptidase (beta-lactamase class C family)
LKVWAAIFVVGMFLSLSFISCSQQQIQKSHKTPVTEIQNTTDIKDIQLIEALKAFIPHIMKNKGTPGLNIALALRGEIIWEAGFGYANLEKKLPMTPQTVTHSGSMGKTYTATAIMQLVEKGIIGLEDPINQYIRDFQITNPKGKREITFRDLLTHRSGLATNAAGSRFEIPKSLAEHVKDGSGQKMFKTYNGTFFQRWSAKVGERFQYSNFGMAILGYLVEITNPEGLSFSEYVQKHIMDPLGMTSSQYPPVQDAEHVREDIFERFSSGYAQFGAVDIPTPAIYFADYPAGTVVTIPRDHIKLLLAYLNDGSFNGNQLLRPETVKLMLSPQIEGAPSGVNLGLTWMLENIGKIDFNFNHGGAHMYGWTNNFRAYPKQGLAIAIFSNHWPMQQNRYKEHKVIFDFISTWLKYEEPDLERSPADPAWAWKTSYVIGLIAVDQIKGALGIEDPLTAEMIEAMAVGGMLRSGSPNSSSGWDPEGFRAGIDDMMQVTMTIPDIQAFIKSDRCRVTPEELKKIYSELGGEQASALLVN